MVVEKENTQVISLLEVLLKALPWGQSAQAYRNPFPTAQSRLGKGRTHKIYIYIYIVFALQGNFSGFTKGYVIGSKRHRMFMKKWHFLFSLYPNSFIIPTYSLEMAHTYS